MKTVIVFNHPYEGSFCNAILEAVQSGLHRSGHTTDLIHLDADGFDPVMRAKDLQAFVKAGKGEPVDDLLDPAILHYRQKLRAADHLVFIFPIWWELMPAMTKGFIDKVIFPGVAYTHDGPYRMAPAFTGIKSVTLITTMNTPSLMYRLLFGNAVKKALMTGTFWKTGYKNRKWISLNMVKFRSDEKRRKWLQQIEQRFARTA